MTICLMIYHEHDSGTYFYLLDVLIAYGIQKVVVLQIKYFVSTILGRKGQYFAIYIIELNKARIF
uniref:Uncharacterized protein n=1 Tax=Arundo donax TaxID=35708 RepID=A0A0A9C8G5_ARUDO